MYKMLLVIFIIVAIILITLIMLQRGRGTNMGSFKTGISNTLFGSSGSTNFITRIISMLAALFFIISLVLDNVNNKNNKRSEWKNLSTSAKVEQNNPIIHAKLNNNNKNITQ